MVKTFPLAHFPDSGLSDNFSPIFTESSKLLVGNPQLEEKVHQRNHPNSW